jgi:hypothetical protein
MARSGPNQDVLALIGRRSPAVGRRCHAVATIGPANGYVRVQLTGRGRDDRSTGSPPTRRRASDPHGYEPARLVRPARVNNIQQPDNAAHQPRHVSPVMPALQPAAQEQKETKSHPNPAPPPTKHSIMGALAVSTAGDASAAVVAPSMSGAAAALSPAARASPSSATRSTSAGASAHPIERTAQEAATKSVAANIPIRFMVILFVRSGPQPRLAERSRPRCHGKPFVVDVRAARRVIPDNDRGVHFLIARGESFLREGDGLSPRDDPSRSTG